MRRLIAFLGLAWVAGLAAPQSRAVEIAGVPTPLHGLGAIAAGPDDALWFRCSCGNVGRMRLDGTVTAFAVPGSSGFGGGDIVAGPDGALWYVDSFDNAIVRITTSGAVTSVPVHGDLSGGLVLGPDGNLWFTATGWVGRLSANGSLTRFRPMRSVAGPRDLTVGPDRNLWITYPTASPRGGWIVRLTPGGTAIRFPASAPGTTGVQPGGIAAGSDGALWFASPNGRSIFRIARSGIVRETTRPFVNPDLFPNDVVRGPDGSIWFSEASDSPSSVRYAYLGRVTPSGAVSEFRLRSSPGSTVSGMTVGPDHNLWVTLSDDDRVFRVESTPIKAHVSTTGAFTLPTPVSCLTLSGSCTIRTSVVRRERPHDRVGGGRFRLKGELRQYRYKTFSAYLRSTLSPRGLKLLSDRGRLSVTVRATVLTPDGQPARAIRAFDAMLVPIEP